MCFDFETSSVNPETTQILQIGACMIERNNLTIVDKFESLLKPVDFSTVEEGALQVNHLTIEQLEKAPDTSIVWELFVNWIRKYDISKKVASTWNLPIGSGFNVQNFDMKILRQYCKKYGPWDEKRQEPKLLHPTFVYDVFQMLSFFTESNQDFKKLNLSFVLEYMGLDKSVIEAHAHDAMGDVIFTTEILTRLLKMSRHLVQKDPTTKKRRLEMKNCLKGWEYPV